MHINHTWSGELHYHPAPKPSLLLTPPPLCFRVCQSQVLPRCEWPQGDAVGAVPPQRVARLRWHEAHPHDAHPLDGCEWAERRAAGHHLLQERQHAVEEPHRTTLRRGTSVNTDTKGEEAEEGDRARSTVWGIVLMSVCLTKPALRCLTS